MRAFMAVISSRASSPPLFKKGANNLWMSLAGPEPAVAEITQAHMESEHGSLIGSTSGYSLIIYGSTLGCSECRTILECAKTSVGCARLSYDVDDLQLSSSNQI